MSWNANTVADNLAGYFELISTSNTLDAIAYNTTIVEVHRRFKPVSAIGGNMPCLALVQEVNVEFCSQDTNWQVFKTFVDFTLYGYVKGATGVDSTTKISFLRTEAAKLIQDCARVLLFHAAAHVTDTPRWLLCAKDNYEKSVPLRFYDEYDVDKNIGVFACPFRIELLWHTRTLQ